jgi:hypothetical protein
VGVAGCVVGVVDGVVGVVDGVVVPVGWVVAVVSSVTAGPDRSGGLAVGGASAPASGTQPAARRAIARAPTTCPIRRFCGAAAPVLRRMVSGSARGE